MKGATQYDVTMGNNSPRDSHCDIAICIYHGIYPLLLWICMPMYVILLWVVLNKNKNKWVFDLSELADMSFKLMIYSCTKTKFLFFSLTDQTLTYILLQYFIMNTNSMKPRPHKNVYSPPPKEMLHLPQ